MALPSPVGQVVPTLDRPAEDRAPWSGLLREPGSSGRIADRRGELMLKRMLAGLLLGGLLVFGIPDAAFARGGGGGGGGHESSGSDHGGGGHSSGEHGGGSGHHAGFEGEHHGGDRDRSGDDHGDRRDRDDGRFSRDHHGDRDGCSDDRELCWRKPGPFRAG